MDLYEYADAISKRWGLVLGLSLLAMVVAAAVNLLITPVYEATAILSVPKLNSSIPCASLVNSTEVEAKVINALRAALPYTEQVSDRDIRGIKIAESQNMIRITARSDTGRKAALIANAWADFGVEQISEAQLGEQQQLVIAKQNVEEAEQNLRAFENEHGFGVFGFGTAEEELQADKELLNDYQIKQGSIERSIEETKTFRETIKGGGADSSTRAISLFITNLLQKVSKESGDNEFPFQVLLMELQADQQVLEQYETTMESIEEALKEAKNLRDNVQKGGSIASPELISTLVVDFLESGSTESAVDSGLQAPSLPTQDLSPSQQMALLDAIVSILESRKALVSTSMNQLSVKAVGTLDATLSALEAKDEALATTIEQLSADISEQEKRLAEMSPELEALIEVRDRAEETYTSLEDKIRKSQFIAEPKVIASAVEPWVPVRPNKVQNIAIACASGLVVGVVVAIREEHLRRRRASRMGRGKKVISMPSQRRR
jgi:capsular polysaccharide biosynthesis protein